MKFINITENSNLAAVDGIVRIIGPNGQDLTVIEGATVPAGSTIVLHSERETSDLVDYQLTLSDLVSDGLDTPNLETENLQTDEISDLPSHKFHDDENHHLVGHEVAHTEVDTSGFTGYFSGVLDYGQLAVTFDDEEVLSNEVTSTFTNIYTVTTATRFTDEDTAITMTEADLLSGVSDSDTALSDFSVTNVTLVGTDATLVDHLDGTFTITPNANYSGTVTLNYDISDGTTTTPSAMDITVTPVNDAPTLIASDNTFDKDTLEASIAVAASASNLLSQAADIDDANGTLQVGKVNGAAVNVGAAVVVTLAYTDADGVAQTQDVNLTVNAD
ncbi:cadherin-like domain-containing protein, partial [Vibrio aestuarianus]|uniref:cadherin-like domain-containing protein n=1 Tax=Vibrio aestuarianus TaxID=28171 RepID=UPI00237CC4B1